MIKIANILGRGLEGAGVTRFSIELEHYIKDILNYDYTTFVIEDKKWPRSKSQTQNFNIVKVKDNNLKNLSEELNKFDVVMYNSIPAKKGFSDKCINEFLEYIVRSVKSCKKIIIQNDHKIQSLSRNANILDISKEMDFILTFSKNSQFIKLLEKNNISTKSKIIEFRNGMDFSLLKDFIKPIDKRLKKISYLGRFATFKEPWRLYNFHPYIKKYNFISHLVGIERSIGALEKMFKQPSKMVNLSNIKNPTYEENDTNLPFVYGPYNRIDGINAVSNGSFGCDFFNITEGQGNILEYAQLEVIGVGLIPVFDYEWSIKTKTIDDITYNSINNFGLFLKKDLSNAEEISNKMNEIYEDKSIFKKYIDTSFEVAYENFDSSNSFKDLLNKILSI